MYAYIIEHKQKSRPIPIMSYIIVAVCGRLEFEANVFNLLCRYVYCGQCC
jgi:hypothetical protein